MSRICSIENKQEYDNSAYDIHLHENYEMNLILTDGVQIVADNHIYTSKR